MCGRFFIESDDAPEELELLLEQAESWGERFAPELKLKRGEIFPGDAAAVIARNKARRTSAFVMRWGFYMGKRLLINARSESAQEKVTFRESMTRRRCLIPASAYYEWDHRKKKPPKLLFQPENSSVMYLAGLYRYEEDGQPVFTILTRAADASIARFHDRMPVILPPDAVDDWLDDQQNPARIMERALSSMEWQPV